MSKIKHKGLSTYRFRDNPEERRFAEAWQATNDNGRTLDYLLDPRNGEHLGSPLPVGDREREVAATIVQWLGSPVGQGFLRDLGYERAKENEPIRPFTAAVQRMLDAAEKAGREAEAHRERRLYCEGTAHGLRAAAQMMAQRGTKKGSAK